MFFRPVGVVLLISALCGMATSVALAAKVTKVRGKKALVTLEGDPAQPGDVFFALGPDGKKRGTIKITKVKGDQALANITAGKVQNGAKLQFKSGKPSTKTARTSTKGQKSDAQSTSSELSTRSYWGLMGGISMQSMAVKNIEINVGGDKDDTSLSGMGFSFSAIFDYELFPQIWFRGQMGMQTLSVTSSDAFCGGAPDYDSDCKVGINYLGLDLWGRYLFSMGNFRPWIGGGFSLLFPMSKDTTAVDSDSANNTNITAFGGGFDWFISPTMAIPVQFEYGLFPTSTDVSANMITVKSGLIFAF